MTKKIKTSFKLTNSHFWYSKTYTSARDYVRNTFLHPSEITNNQKQDILNHYSITNNELEEIIAWCLDLKVQVKH